MKVSPKAVEQSIADSQKVAKARSHRPTWEDVRSEVGAHNLTLIPKENGRVDARVDTSDPEVKRRYSGMMEGWRAAEVEVGREFSARVPTVTLRNRDGKYEKVPAHLAAKKARAAGLYEPLAGRRQKDWSVGKVVLRNGSWMRYEGAGRWEVVDDE